MQVSDWARRHRTARHRLGSIFKAHGIDPVHVYQRCIPCDDPGSRHRYNFVDHYKPLEKAFPGCSVAWDLNHELRTWERYCVVVAHNTISHLPMNREAIHEQRLNGHFVLLAFRLVYRGNCYKPHRVEIPALHGVHRRSNAFGYGNPALHGVHWRSNAFGYGNSWGVARDHLVYGVYSKRDERWTVIR